MRFLIDDEEIDLDGGDLLAVYLTTEEKKLIADMAPDDHVLSVRNPQAKGFGYNKSYHISAWLAKFKKNSEKTYGA